MAKDITIAGHKISKWWLAGGGVAVIGVWYIYKRGASTSPASSSGQDPSAIDPVTGLPYSEDDTVDPATGLTYLAEAQEYGSVQAAEQEISSGSAYYGDPGTGNALDSGYPTLYDNTDVTPAAGTFATNAAWSQAVTAGLVALGYSSQDVAAALGLYFQSQPLGSGSDGVSYVQIIQAAIAEYGPPPVGSYSIIAAPSSGGSNPPVTQPAPGNPPASSTKYATNPVADFKVSGVTKTSANFAWTKSTGVKTYTFEIYSGATLVDSRPALASSNTSVSTHILKAGRSYTASIWANPGQPGGQRASLTFATPKS